MASVSELRAEIARLKRGQKNLANRLEGLQSAQIEQIVKTTIEKLSQKKDPVKAELLWRLRRTRREFVYKKILDIASNGPKDLAEIKYFIVDQGNYCSKPTFYRYIQHLQSTGRLNLMRAQNRVVAAKR